jgi:DNA polymerase I
MRREDGGPANALIGFTDMLLRLWRAERPRAVLVGWDTLEVPTYRHKALEAYQSGREFEDELLEQLDLLPSLVESAGFVSGKAPGYEADDFLAAAATREEAAGGTALVATSDRDAFQLVTERVTVLQPAKGGPARIGPEEVRARYGVMPAQVTDFIALRGDPSDRIPGARGIGPKRGAELLAQYGSLDAMLEAGRFSTEADALLLYRRIATMDREAPLPALPDSAPNWTAGSAFATKLGAPQVARRFEEALAWT